MTTLYSDNFDSDTVGVIAPGWTAITGTWLVGTTAPVSSPNSFGNTSNVNAQIAIYTTGSTSQADQEFTVFQIDSTNGAHCPMIRCDSTGANGYLLTLDAVAGTMKLWKIVASAFTSIATFNPSAPTAGHTLGLSIRASGTTIEGRLWDVTAGQSRPATASMSVVDATRAAGTIGLYWGKAAGGGTGAVDNIAWTDGLASAVTLSGPSSGSTGVASSPFTVGADGAISGTVIVTPADGGAGGTFAPTTVSISSGSPTGTFTYTPSSTGAKTISVTNNGGLTNPANITYTSNVGPITIPVDNASINWSPGNWDTLLVGDFGVSVKSMQTTACGAYAKFSMTGTTTLSIALDSTTLSGFGTNAPYLMWSIGDGAMQLSLLTPGATSLSLATGLIVGTTYTVQVYLRGAVETQGDRWGSAGVSPTNVLRIQGFVIDGTGSVSAYPLVEAKRALCFGDSRTESVRAAGTTTQPQDHARSWAWFAGRALGCEVGVIGYGATGWARAGSGNMPAFPTSFPLYSVGRSRSFTGIDYVFVMHGFNDVANGVSNATITAAVQTWISSARTACGAATWIFVVSDPSGIAAVASGVSAYIAATPSDTKVAFLDTSDTIELTPFSGPISLSTPSWGSVDKCHPLEFAQGMFGAAIARKAQAIAGGAAYATTARTVSLTLVDATGVPRASLTGLTWALFDKTTANSLASIVDSGSGATTNAGGVFTISTKSTLSAGANAWLVISNSDGTVTQNPAAKCFSGPVVLS